MLGAPVRASTALCESIAETPTTRRTRPVVAFVVIVIVVVVIVIFVVVVVLTATASILTLARSYPAEEYLFVGVLRHACLVRLSFTRL